MRDSVVVAGVGTAGIPRAPASSDEDLHSRAASAAVAEAGLCLTDIDGYATVTQEWLRMPVLYMAESLGIQPRWYDGTSVGGSSFLTHVLRAREALRARTVNAVLITYGSTFYSSKGRQLGTMARSSSGLSDAIEGRVGLSIVNAYALAASAHMARYGTEPEDLARIAVAAREWATMNPEAMYREPISVEDVLSSPEISTPLHRLDCCVVSDGGGALVLMREEDARRSVGGRPLVRVSGGGESLGNLHISSMADLTESPAIVSSALAYEDSGISPSDIRMAMLYDSFTITALLQLEDCGLVAKGNVRSLLDNGIGPGGTLPVNVDGGGLSACHPGMRGIFLIIEACRWLRNESNSGPALVNGIGGWLSSSGTLVLEGVG